MLNDRTRIPKVFRHKAQGCEERATLGKTQTGIPNPNGVAPSILRTGPRPCWGCMPFARQTAPEIAERGERRHPVIGHLPLVILWSLSIGDWSFVSHWSFVIRHLPAS